MTLLASIWPAGGETKPLSEMGAAFFLCRALILRTAPGIWCLGRTQSPDRSPAECRSYAALRLGTGLQKFKPKTPCNRVKLLPPKRQGSLSRGRFCSARPEYQKRLPAPETREGLGPRLARKFP